MEVLDSNTVRENCHEVDVVGTGNEGGVVH